MDQVLLEYKHMVTLEDWRIPWSEGQKNDYPNRYKLAYAALNPHSPKK